MPGQPARGEIWRVALEPTVGAEMQKTRPCVVMSGNTIGFLPLRLVVPITDWKARYEERPWMVALEPANGLTKPSAADAFQTRSVSLERFSQRLGRLPPETIAEIAAAIAVVIELDIP